MCARRPFSEHDQGYPLQPAQPTPLQPGKPHSTHAGSTEYQRLISRIFEHTAAYRLSQALFAEQKLRPLLESPDFAEARRVLDVACGPGTNTPHFAGKEYLGLDVNPRYIAYARRRFGRSFEVADVTSWQPPPGMRFDLVLANSFFHHVDDRSARAILARLSTLVATDGHLHVLDLILPARPSLALLLARLDRGRFARPRESWESLVAESFAPLAVEVFPLVVSGITLWEMIYFRCEVRR